MKTQVIWIDFDYVVSRSIHCLTVCVFVTTRDGNLGDISKAGSLHEFLTDLHKEYGPIASFWWGKMYTISIASADLFEEQQHLFDRHRK